MSKRVVVPIVGVTPQYIADYYYAKVSGITNAYVDYYVTAVDNRGNTYKSPIQHVWVGTSQGGSSGGSPNGCNGRVCVSLVPPVVGTPVTLQFSPARARAAAAALQPPLQTLRGQGHGPRQCDPTGLRIQQRRQHLGQQRQRRLAFLGQQHAAAAGHASEPQRQSGSDQPG